MFSIDCAPLSDFEDYQDILAALAGVGVPISRGVPATRPSYQFDYKEVGLDTVKRMLGYAGIAVTNTPLGVAGSFEPVAEDGEWVVFPLAGLQKHFENVAAAAVRAFDQFGSLDSLDNARGPELTPGDQLVVAVLECLHFCKENRLILAFAW